MRFSIGDVVAYHVGVNKDHYWKGVVLEYEIYAENGETEVDYWVRWIDPDGRPDNTPSRVKGWELTEYRDDYIPGPQSIWGLARA